MATWVKYEHITNKKRSGECSKADWDKSNKGGNLSTYFKITETFEKPEFVPKEAKEAVAKATKLDRSNENAETETINNKIDTTNE